MQSVSQGYWSLVWVGTRSENREVEDLSFDCLFHWVLSPSTIKQQENTSNLEESTQVLTFSFYSPWQILPLRPCQASISLPLLQSDTISKDFEEIFVEDESPKIPRKKALPQNILTLKKVSVNPILSGRLGAQVRGIISSCTFFPQ